jgi:hypothetical protein
LRLAAYIENQIPVLDFYFHDMSLKTMEIKIKDRNPSIKSTKQMRTQVDTTQRKNKSKQSTKIR